MRLETEHPSKRDHMCFSAQASFIGAAALAIIGTTTLKTATNKQDKFWAAIPLLFGFQQFCEGIVWLDLSHAIPHSALTVLAKDLYLLFALVLWVLWFPAAFLIAEQDPERKKILKVVLALGLILACINLSKYPISDLSPSVNVHSISYLSEAVLYKKICYLTIIALPPILSSLKYMKFFGALIILSCFFAEYFYATAFTSIWCFLGGFVSAALYLICRANASIRDEGKPQAVKEIIGKNLIHK